MRERRIASILSHFECRALYVHTYSASAQQIALRQMEHTLREREHYVGSFNVAYFPRKMIAPAHFGPPWSRTCHGNERLLPKRKIKKLEHITSALFSLSIPLTLCFCRMSMRINLDNGSNLLSKFILLF